MLMSWLAQTVCSLQDDGSRRGHPPLLATFYREAILAWPGHGGLRALLQQYQEDAVNIETGDEGILLDMDTPEDYARLRDALPKRHSSRVGILDVKGHNYLS